MRKSFALRCWHCKQLIGGKYNSLLNSQHINEGKSSTVFFVCVAHSRVEFMHPRKRTTVSITSWWIPNFIARRIRWSHFRRTWHWIYMVISTWSFFLHGCRTEAIIWFYDFVFLLEWNVLSLAIHSHERKHNKVEKFLYILFIFFFYSY